MASGSSDARGTPGAARAFLHLAGLSAVAIAQPLLDLLGSSPEFFIAHRAGWPDLLLLLAAVLLGPPLILTAIAGAAASADRRAWRPALSVAVGALLALVALQFLKRLVPVDSVILLGGLIAGIGAGLAYARAPAFRQMVSLLGIAVVLVPAVFLARPAIGSLARAGGGDPEVPLSGGATAPSVVVLVFDQLPLVSLLDGAGEIDAELYPNMAALADEGIWYPNATSVANKTAWAVPAIVTGAYPDPERRLPSYHDYPHSLFTLLDRTHALRAYEPVTELCPRGACPAPRPPLGTRLVLQLQDSAVVLAHALTPPGWASRLPPVDTGWKGFATGTGPQAAGGVEGGPATEESGEGAEPDEASSADGRWNWTDRWVERRDSDRGRAAEEFIRSISAGDPRPTLYFMHVLLPHEPYLYLPTGQRFSLVGHTPGLQRGGIWRDVDYPVTVAYQRHLLQVGYADRLVGLLLERLRQTERYEDTVLIVTADHGTSFRPGARFKDPSPVNHSDILAVPLLLKLPGGPRGERDRRQAETVDILPTVAELAGARPSWPVDGVSLLEPGAEREHKRHFVGAAQGPLRLDPGRLAEQLEDSVRAKLEAMGPEGDPGDGVAFGPRSDLLGSPVDSGGLEITELEGAAGTTLDQELMLSHVELDSDFLPLHLTGYFQGNPTALPSRDVAVAVNGAIRATGVIYPFPVLGREGYWSVVLPIDSLQSGYNRVEIFLVIPRGSRTVLRRIYRNPDRELPDRPNLIRDGVSALNGIQVWLSGFHPQSRVDGLPIRWTRGDATVRVSMPAGFQWRGLEIGLRFVPSGTDLEVLVDGCTVFAGEIVEPWIRQFPLGECAPEGREAEIQIRSEPFEDGPVTRGVALSSLVPLERAPSRPADGPG